MSSRLVKAGPLRADWLNQHDPTAEWSQIASDLRIVAVATNGDAQNMAQHAAPAWAVWMRTLTTWLAEDIGGGPRPWKLAWIVNFQKGGTFLFLGALLAYYRNTSVAAWIYLAMHGTYGLVWLLKDLAFPDASWQKRVTLLGGINAFALVLGPYWSFGWLLMRRSQTPDYPLPAHVWYCLCISLCIFGSALMIAADAQKHFTLRYKKGLITDGLHRYIRHPNYLGEMMIYGSFALLTWHWFPAIVLTWVWLMLFAVNMVMKEASMSRHPEWTEYKQRTWWLIPFIL